MTFNSTVWWYNYELQNGQPAQPRALHILIKALKYNINKANVVSHYMTIYSHKSGSKFQILKLMFTVKCQMVVNLITQLMGTTCYATETAKRV